MYIYIRKGSKYSDHNNRIFQLKMNIVCVLQYEENSAVRSTKKRSFINFKCDVQISKKYLKEV